VRAPKSANDELGLFTDTFNQMLAQIQAQDTNLQQAQKKLATQVEVLQHEVAERRSAETKLNLLHKQLLEVSRQAGMAEVATGVLHNVGNVLNSVNVSVTLMRDDVHKSKVGNLSKLASLLEEHTADLAAFLTADPKGQRVLGYLRQLADRLAEEHRETLQMMEEVAKHVEHIKEIVAMQQSYARVSGVRETLPASVLVEDALQINASALERHGITLERQFSEVPQVTVDKHKTLQILINLIGNAKYALSVSGREDRLLRLGIARNGNDTLKITVTDNGIGIPPENLTRIFSHGFTTKKNGHGFGLHSGALAAKEMGGSLSVQSDGIGRGATFTLELPMGNGDTTS
jgi:two-component system, NtrC family, sensor kinase